jgi:hypothetical protein
LRHDEGTIYVSLASHTPAQGTPSAAVIDTRDDSVSYITTSNNAAARSHGFFASRNEHKLYVAHDTGDEVTAVDTDGGGVLYSVGPIVRAEEAVSTYSGRVLWVSSRGDGTVKHIDVDTNTISGRWRLACSRSR